MELVGILFTVILVAIVAGIIIVGIKIENQQTEEIVSQFSPEQKNRLINVQIYPVEGKPNCWIQEMMIAKAKDKGNKIGVKAIYFNMTISNATYQKFCPADFTIAKQEYIEKGLCEGAYVYVFVDPEKGAKLA